ncbi:MAG TPA: MBL fold metallo-hydrolase [Steroidobacteraceae bacterium]|jgi:L-ascorbate metabolism protein UlaG (beta-lactamase superfamily)|nr:MBL fold metallo-hydrolase [Steroidobacteraceae bacterium]
MNTTRVLVAAAAVVLFAFTAAAGRALAAPPADHISTAHGGALTIQPVHHASLMLSWNGKHVLVDPAPLGPGDSGAEFKALPTPDVILITHIHGDHFSVPILQLVAGEHTVIITPHNVYEAMPADLKTKTHAMANGQHTVVDTIPIETVAMYNTTAARSHFHPQGAGNGYVLTFGGKHVYIAGDTEETPELAHLANIDVAFIPMNLPYTQTVEAAAKWVRDFRPKIVYPYHYRNGDGSKADVNMFKKLVGGASDVRLRDWYQAN